MVLKNAADRRATLADDAQPEENRHLEGTMVPLTVQGTPKSGRIDKNRVLVYAVFIIGVGGVQRSFT